MLDHVNGRKGLSNTKVLLYEILQNIPKYKDIDCDEYGLTAFFGYHNCDAAGS